MRVEFIKGKESGQVELPAGSTGLDLLKKLELLPDAHILLRGAVPTPVDDVLHDGILIKIIKVASGG